MSFYRRVNAITLLSFIIFIFGQILVKGPYVPSFYAYSRVFIESKDPADSSLFQWGIYWDFSPMVGVSIGPFFYQGINMSESAKAQVNYFGYAEVNEGLVSTLKTKRTRKFTRKGWNGKQLYVQLHGSIPTGQVQLDNGENAYIEPFVVIVNQANSRVNTWVPSSSDLQAEDWYEIID
jgi:hypothetical protein